MAATGTPTPNIGLRIPLGTDPASVDDINYNSTLLDTKLGAVGNDSVQDQLNDLNSNINKLLVGTTISGVDLNDYKETGLYIVNGNITHSPTGNYGFMFVVKEPGSIARQIYFPQGSNGMYIRRLYEGTWQSWYSVTITQVT